MIEAVARFLRACWAVKYLRETVGWQRQSDVLGTVIVDVTGVDYVPMPVGAHAHRHCQVRSCLRCVVYDALAAHIDTKDVHYSHFVIVLVFISRSVCTQISQRILLRPFQRTVGFGVRTSPVAAVAVFIVRQRRTAMQSVILLRPFVCPSVTSWYNLVVLR